MIHTPEHLNENMAMVICCHGFTGDKVGSNQLSLNLAKALEKAGFITVRFDFLGSGDSEGEFSEDTYVSGWHEDLENVLKWINKKPQLRSLRKVLWGHSLGGLIILTRKDVDNGICGRMVFAPTTNLIDTFRNITFGPELWERACHGEVIENFYGKGFAIKSQFVRDALENNFDSLTDAQNLSTPLLIIHGVKDTAVPIAGSEKLFELYSGPKKFVVLDSDHLATGRQSDLQKEIIQWLNKL